MRRFLLFALLATSFAGGVNAQSLLPAVPSKPESAAKTQLPPALMDIGIDQKLDAQLPLDLYFTDEEGRRVQLREYFGKRPVILSFVYYDCPMLCNMVLNGLVRGMRPMKLDPGTDFEIVTVSFDPKETPAIAAAKKRVYLNAYKLEPTARGWPFIIGDGPSVRALTRAAGFKYRFDQASAQFVHASGIMVATREGRMSRYFYGVEYSARDLRLGLIDASAGRAGSLADQVLLFCFHYDPTTAKYGVAIMNMMRVAGIATVLVLGGFMISNFKHDRKAAA